MRLGRWRSRDAHGVTIAEAVSSGSDEMAGQPHVRPWGGIREHLSIPLFRTAYLLIMSSAVMSALGLPFWALAARQYTTETVGLAATVISAMVLVSSVSQLGMSSVLPRYLPSAQTRTRRLIVLSYVITGAVSIFTGSLAAWTSATWSPPVRFLADDATWFALFVGATLAWTIFSLQDSVLIGMREARWVLGENAVFALAKLGLVVMLANSYPRAGIFLAWIVPAAILILPVNLVIFSRFVPRYEKRAVATEEQWQVRQLRRLIVGNYAGALVGLVGTFLLPILVANQLGAEQAAYFFIPWSLTLGLSVVAANLTASMVVETALAGAKLREYSRTVLGSIVRLVIPAALAVVVLAPELLGLFGHEYAEEGTWLLRLLALGTIPGAVATLGLSVARIRHDGRLVAAVQCTVAVVAVGLTALLLPHIGIEGAGIAWLTSQVVAAIMTAPTLRGALRIVQEEAPEASSAAYKNAEPRSALVDDTEGWMSKWKG
jgi:O-antigen/teichoic acid export membrane protein